VALGLSLLIPGLLVSAVIRQFSITPGHQFGPGGVELGTRTKSARCCVSRLMLSYSYIYVQCTTRSCLISQPSRLRSHLSPSPQ
jgi:hypothetical protein